MFRTLPMKTFFRCLSVCKSLQSSFSGSHLQHQRRNLMLVRSILPDNEIKFNPYYCYNDKTTVCKKSKPERYSLYHDDESLTLYAKYEFPIHHQSYGHYRIVGICNGIICVTDDEFGISHETYLWNPTNGKCIELLYPKFVYEKIGAFDHELGFGFDEKANDYKVIRIIQSDISDEYCEPLDVEIYSLSTGIWRTASHLVFNISFRIFSRFGSGRNYQVYYNGAVHWVCMNKGGSGYMVVAFHFGDELFRFFELPLDIKHDFHWMRKLRPTVFQGSLSLIHYSKPKCSIWKMKDYGDSTSWEKVMDVNLSRYLDRVIGLRKNGQLLIEIQGGLYSYAPAKGKELNYLDEKEFHFWKLIQEGQLEGMHLSQCVYDYDPKYAPKELGIRSKTEGLFMYSFYSESYTESQELLGWANFAEVAKLGSKELEMIHEEDNNSVVLGEEGMHR